MVECLPSKQVVAGSSPVPRSTRPPDLALAAATGLLLLSIYAFPVAFNVLTGKETFVRLVGTDTVPTALLPASLLRDGDLYLDEYGSYFDFRWPTDAYFVRHVGTHLVSVYPVVTALLAPPVYVIPVWAGWAGWVGAPDDTYYVARVAAALLTAIAMGLFYLTCRERLIPWKAVTLTLAVGLGTSVWTTASQGLWQHTGSVLLLCGAMLCLVRGEHDERLLPWAGLLLSAATVARYNNATTALLLAAFVFIHHRRSILAFLVAAAFPVASLLAYNLVVFGAPFELGYGAGVGAGWIEVWWQGVLGLLLSPAKGLFVFSPFMLVALPVTFRAAAGQTRWPLLPYAALGCAVFTLIMGVWWGWYGGVSYGTRMLTDIVPLFGLLLIAACQRFRSRGWIAFGALAVLSVCIQSLGLLDYGAYWHRIFDTPQHWDNWMWDLPNSPIPFYLQRYATRLFGGPPST